jgi:hypothetical protein
MKKGANAAPFCHFRNSDCSGHLPPPTRQAKKATAGGNQAGKASADDGAGDSGSIEGDIINGLNEADWTQTTVAIVKERLIEDRLYQWSDP